MPKVVHFEIATENPERVNTFYSEVFGWKIQKWGDNAYWLVDAGEKGEEGIGGAIMPPMGSQRVINTIAVPDLEAYMQKVTAGGGKVTTAKQGIPTVGWFAYGEDPDGTVFGMLQFDPEAK